MGAGTVLNCLTAKFTLSFASLRQIIECFSELFPGRHGVTHSRNLEANHVSKSFALEFVECALSILAVFVMLPGQENEPITLLAQHQHAWVGHEGRRVILALGDQHIFIEIDSANTECSRKDIRI